MQWRAGELLATEAASGGLSDRRRSPIRVLWYIPASDRLAWPFLDGRASQRESTVDRGGGARWQTWQGIPTPVGAARRGRVMPESPRHAAQHDHRRAGAPLKAARAYGSARDPSRIVREQTSQTEARRGAPARLPAHVHH